MKIEKVKKKIDVGYSKRKKLLDLDILKKHKIKRTHLILLLLSLIFFMFNRQYFLFIFLTIASGIFAFYHSKVNRSPIDFKLALVIGLFITRHYGIVFTIIFFILSDTVPALLGGESLNGSSLIFYLWYFLVNSLVYLYVTCLQ